MSNQVITLVINRKDILCCASSSLTPKKKPDVIYTTYKPHNSVFQDENGLWLFWDETWSSSIGPYKSEYSARNALREYCFYELEGGYNRPTNDPIYEEEFDRELDGNLSSWFYIMPKNFSESLKFLGPYDSREEAEDQLKYYKQYLLDGEPDWETIDKSDCNLLRNDMSLYIEFARKGFEKMFDTVDNQWYYSSSQYELCGPFKTESAAVSAKIEEENPAWYEGDPYNPDGMYVGCECVYCSYCSNN